MPDFRPLGYLRAMTSPSSLSEIPAAAFRARRRRVAERLGHGVLVLPAAPPAVRSRDTTYRYRPDSELAWLCGLTEPGAVAVLVGGEDPEWTLFVPEPDETSTLWSGARLGTEAAAERYGADETLPRSRLDEAFPPLLHRGDRIHYRLGGDPRVEHLVRAALERGRARGPRTGSGPRGVVDPGEVLDELRLRKDEHEVARLREAARVSVEGHRAGMAAARPGVGEWVVEAELEAAFRRAGASGPAFETIVGAGENACVLHYVRNADTLAAGELVLVDAGAELGLYAGDITRSWPVDGRFTPEQRTAYEVVDAARAAAVAAVAPGTTVAEVHETACRVLVEGLVEMGVLQGRVEELVEREAHKPWFPHQTSHWLGLDVHDPGDYAVDGTSRPLEPGMVLTVEPGLYFRPSLADAGPWAGMGIRVEDAVLVTTDGPENLTAALPTAPDAVADLVGSG